MRIVEPQVFLIGETRVIEEGLRAYLEHIGAQEWSTDAPSDVERIIEVYSRSCYKSYGTDLNPNVTRVRQGNKPHLENIKKHRHGSVLEHAFLNFFFVNVSRVFTHELVRHRAGTAISQESLRFVRLENINFWPPLVIRENEEVMEILVQTFKNLEEIQLKLSDVLKIDKKTFEMKKKLTSALRRIAPIGLATTIGWSCNVRALRHVIEMRTHPSAEEEIRLIFGKVGEIVTKRYPNLFGDYEMQMVDGLPHFTTPYNKV